MGTIREKIEEIERRSLSPFASLSSQSKGRQRPQKDDEIRTCFMRDRDRIIHSKAFRRLKHKTQVFFSPEGDHYRTRLTHTLEVAQISRTVAKALFLNEDLTEAIALGHDLGHTPFGHAGEMALSPVMIQETGHPFHHNEQSLRVVDFLEREGEGLNLTFEVRDGILHHTGERVPITLEGKVVRICDRVAYINHDIDDALRAGILEPQDLPQKELEILGHEHGERINTLVRNLIFSSEGRGDIGMDPEVEASMNRMRDFLFETVYLDSYAKTEEKKLGKMLADLFYHFLTHPEELPPEYLPREGEPAAVGVCDYIAGMTDRYALSVYNDLFLPKSWQIK